VLLDDVLVVEEEDEEDVVVVTGGNNVDVLVVVGIHPVTKLQNIFLKDVFVEIADNIASAMFSGQIKLSIFCNANDVLSHVPIFIHGRFGPV
jgi:hypothetical protein